MNATADSLKSSRFWPGLVRTYATSPSIAMCRVPELEFAASLSLEGETLDHCCGDGIFAGLAWPEAKFTAGCDIDARSIERAATRGRHGRTDVCDVSQRLPYDDGAFDLVFNNSALEHVPDVDAALREVGRVTRRSGTFAFNVLNHRYFEWWPGDGASRTGYREWQPFFHAFSLEEWRARLLAAGFGIKDTCGYFVRESAQELALLDCEFSGAALRQRASALVDEFQQMPRWRKWLWWRRLGRLTWQAEPDAGAGFFILAERQ